MSEDYIIIVIGILPAQIFSTQIYHNPFHIFQDFCLQDIQNEITAKNDGNYRVIIDEKIQRPLHQFQIPTIN